MSEKNNPPSEYFNGIYYNPSFFQDNTDISLEFGSKNYLSRIGTASSVATNTSFSGIINANNGLNVTGGETVDSLNATTSLSLDGININSIYQKIAGMSAYLTTATAGASYQTLLGMSSYLTKSGAAGQYQTQSGMSNYLTQYGASLTYLTKTGTEAVSTALLTSFSGDVTVAGTLNGLNIKSYGNGNTSFSTGNTDILGSSNTRFGYFTGSLLGYSNAVFGDQSLQNCTGHSNTAIGHNSQNSNTNYNWNTSVGSNSDITGGSSNIAIGHGAQCSNCSNSIVIGNSITSTTNYEILLGSGIHTVQIPGDVNILGNLTFLSNINNISGDVFGFLEGLQNNIQSSLDNIASSFNSLPENFQTKIEANDFAVFVEETYYNRTFINDFMSFVGANFVQKPLSGQLPTWYITASFGEVGTTPGGCKIGASTNIGGKFDQVLTYGGVSASAFNTSTAVFTAPAAGTYFFQLNVFNTGLNSIGRTLIFQSQSSFMGSQYCNFNDNFNGEENSYQWCTMIRLGTNGTAYFYTMNTPITLNYGMMHTNLTITKIF